uniref:RluA family pseudouridine synthase n=1 Tax=candidate division WOR-3 bacterium TaxID=2052148 RepID=A0A7V3VUH2_UNCW3
MNKKIFTIPPELNGKRLDYIIGLFMDLPRKDAKKIVEDGFVLVNNLRVTFPSRKVKKGDKVILIEIEKSESVLKILYEDRSVIVIDKPPGLITQRINSEAGYAVDEELRRMGKNIYPVHRLDRETSGVMVFACNTNARDFLMNEFRSHRVKKIYIGVVEGKLDKDKGVLRGKIQKTKEYAETYYEVLKELKGATLLKLFPRTGRTHQLRLQFAQIGNPIVGDKKYYKIKKPVILFERQALHSYAIEFIHPEKKEWMRFTAPIPLDLKRLIERLT